MSRPMEDRVAQAMAHLKAAEQAAASARAELDAASVTARSTDRSVRVSVGAKGELTSLEFLDGKYRTMAAPQLSAAVLEAANKARAEMARRVVATLDPLTRMTARGAAPERMGVDWESVFGSLLRETSVAEGPTAMSRLRDEIVEDDEEPAAPPGVARGTDDGRRERQEGA
ncbi:YbaB/EbfC family nucleoid-associated protein [Streptomyces sp. Tu 3180]|uniref:YbaB/EbfC family nucleoid-associated protein n=1 Tax=Streptomyces sp. Tu 3180 TaxID=2682611 RepID=UPI00135AD152|nr:YbaB/EbfC family nucleoid-associated protein [Streptomyces sp. Tu 3180]KAF3467609.1 YbaB/EbfC family nucleoid-associated protein [Streptomyces sp. Tu 3180]